jgi:rubrerythrin
VFGGGTGIYFSFSLCYPFIFGIIEIQLNRKIMSRRITTNEEKQAKKLAELLTNIEVDLELIGVYFAQNVSSTLYNRLQIVYETAQEIKERQNDRNYY